MPVGNGSDWTVITQKRWLRGLASCSKIMRWLRRSWYQDSLTDTFLRSCRVRQNARRRITNRRFASCAHSLVAWYLIRSPHITSRSTSRLARLRRDVTAKWRCLVMRLIRQSCGAISKPTRAQRREYEIVNERVIATSPTKKSRNLKRSARRGW